MNNYGKLLIMILMLIIILLSSIFIGRYPVQMKIIYQKIVSSLGHITYNTGLSEGSNDWAVFYYIRLPRIILVALLGAALAVTGATYQSIFRNPLVSPDILGVSAGAGFGVALGMLNFNSSLIYIYLLAFIFGLSAVGLSYLIAYWAHHRNMMIMVLAGIVVTALFNALISILKYLADPFEKLPGIIFWLLGGFGRTGWLEVTMALPFILIGVMTVYLLRWQLNVISLGEEEAQALGLNVTIIQVVLVSVTTSMVAIAVATAGQITWIGLIIPHIARFIMGPDHRYLIPASLLLGSSFLLIMDNLARTLSSAEIPISIISALVGAPFFIYLLIYRRESGWS